MITVLLVALASFTLGGSISFASKVNQEVTNTVTVGTSYITSESQLQQLVNAPFTVVSTTGTALSCEFWNFSFTAVQGQYLSLNLTSNVPLDVYVVPDSNYQSWLKEGNCGNQADAVASKRLAVAYDFNGVLPSSEKWDIILVNSSSTRNATGFIVAYLSTGNFTVTEVLLSTVSTTVTPVGNMTTSSNAPSTGIPGFPIESVVLGIFTGLIVLMILRSRQKGTENT